MKEQLNKNGRQKAEQNHEINLSDRYISVRWQRGNMMNYQKTASQSIMVQERIRGHLLGIG